MEIIANVQKYVSWENIKNEMHLMFPQPLAEILGVDKTFFGKPIGNDKYQFKYGVDLNTHSNRFYVYSDVANYTYIGDVTAPILRVIPFKYIQGEIHFHQEFLNLHYVPVAKSYIDQKKKVQVGKDQEKAQSEKDSHSKNQGGKKPNQQSGTYTMKTFCKPNEQLFSQ